MGSLPPDEAKEVMDTSHQASRSPEQVDLNQLEDLAVAYIGQSKELDKYRDIVSKLLEAIEMMTANKAVMTMLDDIKKDIK